MGIAHESEKPPAGSPEEPIIITFEIKGLNLIPHIYDTASGEKWDYATFLKPEGEDAKSFCNRIAEAIECGLGRPVRYIVPNKVVETPREKLITAQKLRTSIESSGARKALVIIVVALLLAMVGFRARDQYISYQTDLYKSVRYKQAKNLFDKDQEQYGQNTRQREYRDSIENLFSIERKYHTGEALKATEVSLARQDVDKARKAYVDEGKRKLQEEERAKDAAEEERRRREKEEQERKEREAAKEAEDQRRREETEASYIDPGYLSMPVSGEQLSAEIQQVIDDISKYHGKIGWTDYEKKSDLYQQYADAYIYSHGWTYDHENPGSGTFQITEGDVLTALAALAQARRYMVVEQAVNPNLEDEAMTYDPHDPFVYVTETGHRFHSNEKCRGLNNANDTYVMKRNEARTEGYSECQICY